MNIPNLPLGGLKDEAEWLLFFQQLVTELQQNVGQQGFRPPVVSNDDKATIEQSGVQDGTLIVNSGKLMVAVGGVFKELEVI